jgi:hypothetical protein
MGVDLIDLHSRGRSDLDVAEIDSETDAYDRGFDQKSVKKGVLLSELDWLAAQYKKREHQQNKIP